MSPKKVEVELFEGPRGLGKFKVITLLMVVFGLLLMFLGFVGYVTAVPLYIFTVFGSITIELTIFVLGFILIVAGCVGRVIIALVEAWRK